MNRAEDCGVGTHKSKKNATNKSATTSDKTQGKEGEKDDDNDDDEEDETAAALGEHVERMRQRVERSFMAEFTKSLVCLVRMEHRRQPAFDAMIASGRVEWPKLDYFTKQVYIFT